MASILTALEGSPQQSGAGAWLGVLEIDTPMYDIQGQYGGILGTHQ
jgi:hypothetical protein